MDRGGCGRTLYMALKVLRASGTPSRIRQKAFEKNNIKSINRSIDTEREREREIVRVSQ